MKRIIITKAYAIALCAVIILGGLVFANSIIKKNIAIKTPPSTKSTIKYESSIEKMKKDLKASMLALNIPATNVVLLENGKIVYQESFGKANKVSNIPLTKDTLFNMGSISKMYITAAIIKLQQDDKLSLDDPIVKYIPDFKMTDPRYKDITIRMLLNHSSGLPGSNFHNTFLIESDTNKNYIKNTLLDLKDEELKANPGEYSVYANEGFNLAQYIVEIVSGTDYETYINKTFFKPMGISKTYLSSNKSLVDSMFARLYDKDGNILPRELMPRQFAGAGGLVSTAEEIAIFGEKILSPKAGIFSKKSISILRETQGISSKFGKESFFNGLGWDSIDPKITNTQVFAKSGGTIQYQTQLIVAPDAGITIVGLSTIPSSINPIMSNFMFNVLKEKNIIPINNSSVTVPEETELKEDLSMYTGNYSVGMVPLLAKIDIQDNKLNIKLGLNNPQLHQFMYRKDNAFWSNKIENDGYERYSFKKIDGKIFLVKNTISKDYNYSQVIAQKLEKGSINKEWLKLNNTTWLQTNILRNDIYTEMEVSKLKVTADMDGHVYLNELPFKIFDNTTAKAPLETVTNTGNLIHKGNTLTYRGFKLINANSIPVFNINKMKKFTLPEENTAYWYKVTSPIKITSYTDFSKVRINVFNSDGLISFDNMSQVGEIQVPADSFIMFTGKKNTDVSLTIRTLDNN